MAEILKNVRHDPNHSQPRPEYLLFLYTQAFPQRLFARPILFGKALIHDYDRGSRQAVGIREHSAVLRLHLHGLEIIVANHQTTGFRQLYFVVLAALQFKRERSEEHTSELQSRG